MSARRPEEAPEAAETSVLAAARRGLALAAWIASLGAVLASTGEEPQPWTATATSARELVVGDDGSTEVALAEGAPIHLAVDLASSGTFFREDHTPLEIAPTTTLRVWFAGDWAEGSAGVRVGAFAVDPDARGCELRARDASIDAAVPADPAVPVVLAVPELGERATVVLLTEAPATFSGFLVVEAEAAWAVEAGGNGQGYDVAPDVRRVDAGCEGGAR